jgi:hypothetical protein
VPKTGEFVSGIVLAVDKAARNYSVHGTELAMRGVVACFRPQKVRENNTEVQICVVRHIYEGGRGDEV